MEEVCRLLARAPALGERETKAAAYLARSLPDSIFSLDGGTVTLMPTERATAMTTTEALRLLEIEYGSEVEKATQQMRIEITLERAVLRLAAIVAPRMTDEKRRHGLRDAAIAARWGAWRVEKGLLERMRQRACEGVSAAEMAEGLNQQKFLRQYPPTGGAKRSSQQLIENAMRSARIERALLAGCP